jgi:riboflavin synthase
MFTGLVEAVGTVVSRTAIAGGVRIRIATALAPEMALGDSLAVNGCCLTAIELTGDEFTADVGPESVRVTALGHLDEGALVNLERPLRPDSRMGGHFVQGHVDGVGQVRALRAEQDFHWLTVQFPGALARYIVSKGSITVDGISLTVAHLRADEFDVQLVPFTLAHTNLQRTRAGDPVNLECDMIGKYVARAMDLYAPPAPGVLS